MRCFCVMQRLKQLYKERTAVAVMALCAVLVIATPIPAQASVVDSNIFEGIKSKIFPERITNLISNKEGAAPLYADYSRDERVAKIRAYFEKRNAPAAEHAEDFVFFADLYGIHPYLVAGIATIESSGFVNACSGATYSGLGWGSCKINFESYRDGIKVVSYNLAGLNPRTAPYYKDKSISEIIDKYNPPSVRPEYNSLINGVMEKIETQSI